MRPRPRLRLDLVAVAVAVPLFIQLKGINGSATRPRLRLDLVAVAVAVPPLYSIKGKKGKCDWTATATGTGRPQSRLVAVAVAVALPFIPNALIKGKTQENHYSGYTAQSCTSNTCCGRHVPCPDFAQQPALVTKPCGRCDQQPKRASRPHTRTSKAQPARAWVRTPQLSLYNLPNAAKQIDLRRRPPKASAVCPLRIC